MDNSLYSCYCSILKEELVPAMGCTEPIAVAYAAAKARAALGENVEEVTVYASANIIKNVKSVVVPNTGGLHGISAAAAAGIVAGKEEKELQVLSEVTPNEISAINDFIGRTKIALKPSEQPYIFHIRICLKGNGHTASCEIAGYHTNIISIEKDGEILFAKKYEESVDSHRTDRSLLSVKDIIDFAEQVNIDDVREIIARQISYNMAIAKEGLSGNWGAGIGKILLKSYGDTIQNRAKAYAAAASDARMGGCELPVVINSGSGNQGVTASLPVIAYAEELNSSKDQLYRALVVANLITIHIKTGIGRLSAYCGATSAGCGAAAGISYLYGGRFYEIAHAVVNGLAINSGMICDGAKPSCAAKIASAVEAGLLGLKMQHNDSQFYGGDGIIVKGIENTIRNVGLLARNGMEQTDKEIIRLMTENAPKA